MTANCLHPGFVATNFTTGEGWLYWVMRQAARVVAISPEDGAKTSVYLASSPDVEGVSGKYFVKCRPVQSRPTSYDEAAARRLWEVSEAMTRPGGKADD